MCVTYCTAWHSFRTFYKGNGVLITCERIFGILFGCGRKNKISKNIWEPVFENVIIILDFLLADT